jgi:hypothetical protein
LHRPLDDFAYARARRPVIKTEDVSGIEKSGLRSALDKKSDEVRKGLVKAFTFKKKDKKGHDTDAVIDFRPQSAATVRPTFAPASHSREPIDEEYEPDVPPVGYQGGTPLSPDVPWDERGGLMSPSQIANKPSTVFDVVNAFHVKRWIGGGRPVQRWNKLRKDPELWDPNGDVLVFFGYRGQSPRPEPSFRLSSHVIEATESRFLITLLREGSTEEDIHMPTSPPGAPPMLQHHGSYRHQQHLGPAEFGQSREPTPPISQDSSLREMDGQISYEMYFPVPTHMTRLDQVRDVITTRNIFALLYHASLVGLSLHQALADLFSRLEMYMQPDADNVGTILDYLAARGIDDVRNDPETAVSLLAWSEGSDIRWEEGWCESFLHCAGMYSRLEKCADFHHVTPITRTLLERAYLETQLRVQAAEERLAAFQYSSMWPSSVAIPANASGPVGVSPAKAAADRLQMFFVQYYTREFGSWPPPPPRQAPGQPAIGTAHGGDDGEEEVWLTRTVAQTLQRDFAALYDYLVNRDIVWDGSEARPGRKWMLVSESGNRAFEADRPEVPMTDMLIEFDNKNRFPHIPYPYPLVPESIPPLADTNNLSKDGSASGIFGAKSNKRNATSGAGGGGTGRSGAMERRIQLAYAEATNIYVLGSESTHSNLIDAFGKFEKADRIGDVDPATARLGRWVLIYGVLQTLASISVDAPNVRYRDGVAYHLSPRLKGAKMPPWKSSSHHDAHRHHHHNPFPEATHELSHCWTVPATWSAGSRSASNANTSGAESSAEEGGGGDASPVRAYGYRGKKYPFPMPQHKKLPLPPPSATSTSTTSRSAHRSNSSIRTTPSAAGSAPTSALPPTPTSTAHTASSVYTAATSTSSSSAPTSLTASAAYSSHESDCSSSMSPTSPPFPSVPARHRGRRPGRENNSNSAVAHHHHMVSPAVGGGGRRYIDPVEEEEQYRAHHAHAHARPPPGHYEQQMGGGGSSSQNWNNNNHNNNNGYRQGSSAFLVLDELMDDDEGEGFATAFNSAVQLGTESGWDRDQDRQGQDPDRRTRGDREDRSGSNSKRSSRAGLGQDSRGPSARGSWAADRSLPLPQPLFNRDGGRSGTGSGSNSHSPSPGPVIRDFDDLDVIDQHAP